MATPVMASSESGVPNTRSGPNFSNSPRVVPWIAFGSSTSKPNRITDESRAISCSVASRTASTYDSSRSISPVINVRIKLRRLGPRALLRESESIFNFSLHFHFDTPPLCRIELGAQSFDRIVLQPGLSFFSRSVTELKIVVGSHMLFEPVGQTFEEERTGTPAPELADRLADAFINARHIVIRNLLCRHALRPGALADVIQLLPLRLMGVNRITIIFANKDHRQRFECREVQTLIKNPFVDRSVTKKTCHDIIFALQLEGIGKSDSLRNRRSDHG